MAACCYLRGWGGGLVLTPSSGACAYVCAFPRWMRLAAARKQRCSSPLFGRWPPHGRKGWRRGGGRARSSSSGSMIRQPGRRTLSGAPNLGVNAPFAHRKCAFLLCNFVFVHSSGRTWCKGLARPWRLRWWAARRGLRPSAGPSVASVGSSISCDFSDLVMFSVVFASSSPEQL